MPELPEVETVRRGLADLIVGLKIKDLEVLNPKSLRAAAKNPQKILIGATVQDVQRRGKMLIISLSGGYTLLVHLRMTGQVVFVSSKKRYGGGHPNNSLLNELPDSSTRIICSFQGGGKLFFNDQRKFGYWQLVANDQVSSDAFLSKLGPEPLEKFSFEQFNKNLQKRKKSIIKAVLLDQTFLAGIGNIYADEALFAAGIYPGTKVQDIRKIQLIKLHQAIIEILQTAIKLGGSSDRNYVDAQGLRGGYLRVAKVFRREGKNCLKCSAIIQKTRLAGRGTHFCPVCQPKGVKKQ